MEQLKEFRARLDKLDTELVALLGKRFEIIREVGHYKKAEGIPMMQKNRVIEVIERCATLGQQYDLDIEFMRKLYTLIVDQACNLEDSIIDN